MPTQAPAGPPALPGPAPPAPAPTCDDCFEAQAAEHACQTCKLRFCPAHAAVHSIRKSTRAHALVPVECFECAPA